MQVEPEYPGVYVKEVASGVRSIEGVPTSTVAFVGGAPSGATRKVHGFGEYGADGGASAEPLLTDAVRLFFAGGGTGVWIAPDLPALDAVPDLALLALPGETGVDELTAALAYADSRRAFLIVDAAAGDPDAAVGLVQALRATGSANAAVYVPHLETDSPPATCAPSGAVAAVYVRTDTTRGVWKAPAGLEAVVAAVRAPAVPLDDAAASRLNDAHVNAIRAFAGHGVVVWGARTIAEPRSDWKYVPVRRLSLYLERSIGAGLEWASSEPNDEPLWAKVRAEVGKFLHGLFRAGAFVGRTPKEGYLVKCDADTMTQDDLDAGRLVVLVGFAPLKPAEFVIVRIQKVLAG